MSDKPKLPAAGMLEISISGGENLQGHLVGQLVFDKDNPFAAELLQATSIPAMISIKDKDSVNSSELINQPSKETLQTEEEPLVEEEEETEDEDAPSVACSSPRTSVMTLPGSDQDTRNDNWAKKTGVKFPSASAFVSYSDGKVRCNACPDCLRGGSDRREEWSPPSQLNTNGPESVCFWQNMNCSQEVPVPPVSMMWGKERMAAGSEDTTGGNDKGYNGDGNGQQQQHPDQQFYRDASHNIIYKEDPQQFSHSQTAAFTPCGQPNRMNPGSPQSVYMQQPYSRMTQVSRQPHSILHATTILPQPPYVRPPYDAQPTMRNGSMFSAPCRGDRPCPVTDCPVYPQQGAWDRTYPSTLTAGGDLCMPNKPGYDPITGKQYGKPYAMQQMEDCPTNKNFGPNEMDYPRSGYPQYYAVSGISRQPWNDVPQNYPSDYYNYVVSGRQRAGADNPVKIPGSEVESFPVESFPEGKLNGKCTLHDHDESKVDDLEIRLKQSLSSSQETCPQCISKSGCACTCTCEANADQTDLTSSLIPKCSCHQLYQSSNHTCYEDKQMASDKCSDGDPTNLPLTGEVMTCEPLRAGMDPRCRPPPKKEDAKKKEQGKPEGHEFTQHFKYRSVDKDPCGTYDIIEFDQAENLTKLASQNGGNGGNNNNNNGGSDAKGGVSNDLDHVVHVKYRNVDKSCCGEFDIQEGEQIDVRKIILPGTCMRGGQDNNNNNNKNNKCGKKNDNDNECARRLRSGMDYGWTTPYGMERTGPSAIQCYKHEFLENGVNGFPVIQPVNERPTQRLRAGMDVIRKSDKGTSPPQTPYQSPREGLACRQRAGMDQQGGGNHEFTQKFKYRCADKTPCGTYDLLEMETFEDMRVLNPNKSQPPPSNHSMCSRNRGGMDSHEILENAMNENNRKKTLDMKQNSTMEHLRAGMDCVLPNLLKTKSLDYKKRNLSVIECKNMENLSINAISDINAFGDTRTNCNKKISESSLTDASAKHKNELNYEMPAIEKPCRKSSEVTNLRAGMDHTGPVSNAPDVDYFVHSKYRNVDRSSCGELNVQEGEQRDIRLLSTCCPDANQHSKESKCHHKDHCSSSPRSSQCQSICPPACSPSPRCVHITCPSQHSTPRHSPVTISCGSHQKDRKHCKSDVLSNFRDVSFTDYSPSDGESDSKSSEISDMLKQEIRRLRKLNEEALAMISAHRCSTQQNLQKQPLICQGGRTTSNYCTTQGSGGTRGKHLHLYINRLVNECASDVNDTVRKKIIEGVLEFVRSNSDWLKLNFPKDSGDESDAPRSKAVNFQVSGTFKYNKDKEGGKEQDMTITSMQIMSGCDDFKPSGPGSTTKDSPTPTVKEDAEEEQKADEEE